MRTLALSLLIALLATPASAENSGYENAQAFITEYKDGSNIYARLYIRGVSEGIGWYNTVVTVKLRGEPAYCPPDKLALVDAQHVSMMKAFLTKYPDLKEMPVPMVLLYTLRDAFPCK